MKKVKVFLVMSAITMVLSACGAEDSSAQLTESGDAISGTKKEEAMEQEVENQDESEVVEKEVAVEQEESFECLPEVMNASPFDQLFQIDNTIIRLDETMSLDELITAMKNSGVEYIFKVDDADYNPNGVLESDENILLYVYKNEKKYITFLLTNCSENTVNLDSKEVVLESVFFDIEDSDAKSNIYCFNGIRQDGTSHTAEEIKELLTGYENYISERSEEAWNRKYIRFFRGSGVGEDPIFMEFVFNAEKGSFLGFVGCN